MSSRIGSWHHIHLLHAPSHHGVHRCHRRHHGPLHRSSRQHLLLWLGMSTLSTMSSTRSTLPFRGARSGFLPRCLRTSTRLIPLRGPLLIALPRGISIGFRLVTFGSMYISPIDDHVPGKVAGHAVQGCVFSKLSASRASPRCIVGSSHCCFDTADQLQISGMM